MSLWNVNQDNINIHTEVGGFSRGVNILIDLKHGIL